MPFRFVTVVSLHAVDAATGQPVPFAAEFVKKAQAAIAAALAPQRQEAACTTSSGSLLYVASTVTDDEAAGPVVAEPQLQIAPDLPPGVIAVLDQASADIAILSMKALKAPNDGAPPERSLAAATRYAHRYSITVCPDCAADLTAPNSVDVRFNVNDVITTLPSRLDATGLLVDVGGLIDAGYHSGTDCRNCAIAGIEDFEIDPNVVD